MGKIIDIVGLERIYMFNQMMRYLTLFLKYSTPKKLLNFIHCEYELLTKKSRLKSRPYMVKLEPTNICNLDCEFCDRKKTNYGDGFIAFDNFKKIFDPLKDYLYYYPVYLWGEPLLHKDIGRIIKYAHDNKVATYLSSNLNHFNEEIAEKIVRSGLDSLNVALDGASEENYSRYRKNGDFNKVIKNLSTLVKTKRRLKSKTPLVELQFILFKYNEHEIEKIKKIAKDIGVDSLKLRPGVIPNEDWRPQNKKLVSKGYLNKRSKKKTCWWLWRTVNISWNGFVYPCCRKVFQKSFGNVLNEKFSAIWNNKHYVESRKCFSSQDKTDSPCCGCEFPYGALHA